MNARESTAHRYIAQPFGVVDEIAKWTGDPADLPAEWLATGTVTITSDGTLLVDTIAGPIPTDVGGYVVASPTGNYYPISADTFHAKYTGEEL